MRFHTLIRIQFFDTFICRIGISRYHAATINSQVSISDTLCLHISTEGMTMCAIQKDHTFSAYTQFLLVPDSVVHS